MVRLPRSARKLEREMSDVEKHAEDAEKLFTHFVDLHLEREKMRHVTHPINPEKALQQLKKNIQREGTILKLLERDLEGVNDDLSDAIEGFKKSSRMVSNEAIKELNFLKELIEAVANKMDFLKKKQKMYDHNKTSYSQLRKVIDDTHDEEVKILKDISNIIAPIRIQKIQQDVESAQKILEACKHNRKKLDKLILEYRKQIATGRAFSLGVGFILGVIVSGALADSENFNFAYAIGLTASLSALSHFLLASLAGYKKLYETLKRDAAKDTGM
jgi:hypothetical protein